MLIKLGGIYRAQGALVRGQPLADQTWIIYRAQGHPYGRSSLD